MRQPLVVKAVLTKFDNHVLWLSRIANYSWTCLNLHTHILSNSVYIYIIIYMFNKDSATFCPETTPPSVFSAPRMALAAKSPVSIWSAAAWTSWTWRVGRVGSFLRCRLQCRLQQKKIKHHVHPKARLPCRQHGVWHVVSGPSWCLGRASTGSQISTPPPKSKQHHHESWYLALWLYATLQDQNSVE